MESSTTNAVIAAISGIVGAGLPPVVAELLRRWRKKPTGSVPVVLQPWRWLTIVSFAAGLTALIITLWPHKPSFQTFTDQTEGHDNAEIAVAVPDGQQVTVVVSANASAVSQSAAFRAGLQVDISDNEQIVATGFQWIPQYLYDPEKFEGDASMKKDQIYDQTHFPLVARPIKRMERMGPIILSVATSAIIKLNAGNHVIRAKCSGGDVGNYHVRLSYIEIRNWSRN